MVPRDKVPLDRAVTIHWDDHQIPFIEASTDHDAATGLGIVHGHLRLGQIEVLRRISQGRLAEMIGAAGIEMDQRLRTLDVGRAVPGMLAMMPAATRDWLEAFARGLNHYLMRTPCLPPEFAIFALQREPWAVADVLTLGRLLSADVNWLVWLRLLQFRDDPDWPALWRKLAEADSLSFEFSRTAGGANSFRQQFAGDRRRTHAERSGNHRQRSAFAIGPAKSMADRRDEIAVVQRCRADVAGLAVRCARSESLDRMGRNQSACGEQRRRRRSRRFSQGSAGRTADQGALGSATHDRGAQLTLGANGHRYTGAALDGASAER